MLFATQKAPKSTRSVLSRKGHRRKAEKFFSILFVPNKKYGKSCRGAAKDLILLVGSCCLSGLIRGLQNLESSRKGNGFILFACTKRTKSTPEVCEPLDSGDDSKLCRKRF